MKQSEIRRLRQLTNFEDLVDYLRDELDWPIEVEDAEEIVFEYRPQELGIDPRHAVQIESIKQIRPLASSQPWGVFFIKFESKRLPVVVLRRILRALVPASRKRRAEQPVWDVSDLLFISAFGDAAAGQREIAFAHFHQDKGDLPTLRVLGWDGSDTPLKLDFVDAALRRRMRWPDDPADHDSWRKTWSQAFKHRYGHVIRTADALATALAGLARRIRSAALLLLAHESETGPLRSLHKAFQTALIHDLGEADFADTYAQTITYGLLTAAISRTEMTAGIHSTALFADNVADMVPITNPFLREMLQIFLRAGGRKGGIDFDELGIQDVVELLRGEETDLPAVLRDFGNKTQSEDPVIHFYEHFLAAYDKELKVQRGVFYTPQPVVSYIVRSVHELLQSEFGLADGLADTTTWGEIAQRHPDLAIPVGTDSDSPFVVILDPATGTATFPVEVVEVIYQTLTAKWRKEGMNAAQRQDAWNEYVPKHLLPRLYGYELMMAPYAIAHMKMGLKLYETGYRFASDERVRIYLTNTLEPPNEQPVLTNVLPALAHEALAVSRIKRKQKFTVIIGNPPYSNFGQLNKIPFILNLLEDYKRELGEKKLNLDDDFIKFLRYAHHLIEQTKTGIVGMITNNTYIDGITHRQMRRFMIEGFDAIYLVNLHGNSQKKEVCPDGSKDENIFDIQQGVGLSFLISNRKHPQKSIEYADFWGTRETKYHLLQTQSLGVTLLDMIDADPPYYFFVPKNFDLIDEYSNYLSLVDIFEVNGPGVKTERDRVSIHWDQQTLKDTVMAFKSLPEAELRKMFNLSSDSRDWKVMNAKNDVMLNDSPERYTQIQYRPFDFRHIWYSGKTRGFVGTPGYPVMQNMLYPKALGLISMRQYKYNVPEYCYVFVSRVLIDNRIFASNRGIANIFPLNIRANQIDNQTTFKFVDQHNNIRAAFLDEASLKFGKINDPKLIFDYIYATLHSRIYRQRYAEFLKIDFPRVPITSNLDLFHTLIQLGSELVSLHLVEFALEHESDVLIDWPRYPRWCSFSGSNRVIEKFPSSSKAWHNGQVAINVSSGFVGVPEDVWNFYIGGYQVCHKWLKDRQGRTLTDADILHFCKIVTAFSETIRIMGEIDEVIEAHGGWPIK